MVDLTIERVDALKEVVNIGVLNSITALAQLLNKNLVTQPPDFINFSNGDLGLIIGQSEKILVITCTIWGNMEGVLVLAFKLSDVGEMVDTVTDGQFQISRADGELDEIDKSTMQELASIVSGNLVSPIADFLNLSISQSIPSVSNPVFSTAIDFKENPEFTFSFRNLIYDQDKIFAAFLFVPNEKTLPVIFDAIGI